MAIQLIVGSFSSSTISTNHLRLFCIFQLFVAQDTLVTLNSGHFKKISTGVNGSKVGPFWQLPHALEPLFSRKHESIFHVSLDSLPYALSYDLLHYTFSIMSALRQVKNFMNAYRG